GGYLVNWAIGHTDRFKAAISMFGIFELRSDFSNSRLSRWEHDYLAAHYWEDPEIYRRLSPATYLEAIRTPTLILHGEEDDNTAISNSRELYRALVHRGVPARFVRYPREGHGILEPNHRLDELRRSLAWMDRYLRAPGEAVFRLGDRVRDPAGRLELCVTSAEIAEYLGRKLPDGEPEESLLEVVFTVHNLDPASYSAPVTLPLTDAGLTLAGGCDHGAMLPSGVSLDVPGGKVLIEGDNLRLAQRPDPETGELAFAVAIAFQVPRSGSGLLTVADFPAVAVSWSGEDDEGSPNAEPASG
ncbi:MAG TPA: prolyl oligopeptidase family serine peptidase, partial [Chthonomonadaceae bacterium]|nr:prolyl oligopeptidase family serine peptidase [Chthonomonadaceae bacterium]